MPIKTGRLRFRESWNGKQILQVEEIRYYGRIGAGGRTNSEERREWRDATVSEALDVVCAKSTEKLWRGAGVQGSCTQSSLLRP